MPGHNYTPKVLLSAQMLIDGAAGDTLITLPAGGDLENPVQVDLPADLENAADIDALCNGGASFAANVSGSTLIAAAAQAAGVVGPAGIEINTDDRVLWFAGEPFTVVCDQDPCVYGLHGSPLQSTPQNGRHEAVAPDDWQRGCFGSGATAFNFTADSGAEFDFNAPGGFYASLPHFVRSGFDAAAADPELNPTQNLTQLLCAAAPAVGRLFVVPDVQHSSAQGLAPFFGRTAFTVSSAAQVVQVADLLALSDIWAHLGFRADSQWINLSGEMVLISSYTATGAVALDRPLDQMDPTIIEFTNELQLSDGQIERNNVFAVDGWDLAFTFTGQRLGNTVQPGKHFLQQLCKSKFLTVWQSSEEPRLATEEITDAHHTAEWRGYVGKRRLTPVKGWKPRALTLITKTRAIYASIPISTVRYAR